MVRSAFNQRHLLSIDLFLYEVCENLLLLRKIKKRFIFCSSIWFFSNVRDSNLFILALKLLKAQAYREPTSRRSFFFHKCSLQDDVLICRLCRSDLRTKSFWAQSLIQTALVFWACPWYSLRRIITISNITLKEWASTTHNVIRNSPAQRKIWYTFVHWARNNQKRQSAKETALKVKNKLQNTFFIFRFNTNSTHCHGPWQSQFPISWWSSARTKLIAHQKYNSNFRFCFHWNKVYSSLSAKAHNKTRINVENWK